MTKQDLFNLELGNYKLTDKAYRYDLVVHLTNDKERCYRIMVEGALNGSVFMIETTEKFTGNKTITALATIGGLSLHSDDVYSLLNDLNLTN
jgi:hypothetical protein